MIRQRNFESNRTQKGTALMLGAASLVFLIPVIGLAVDVGFLYASKARLQTAVDGASLAAARSLNLGLTLSAQETAAAQNAVNWFYGNFPPGTWSTTNTLMDTTAAHVNIFVDASNAQLDHVNVTATTSVPTYFMKWFGSPSTVITAIGNATRRSVVVMMVLDRSTSMCEDSSGTVHSNCSETVSPTLPCASMITAAKQFTGTFAEGRDYIGLVSFGENAYIHSAPTQTFQTKLGYTNNSGSGTGEIDKIVCNGGTNTAEGIAMGYQLLYQTGLPGALNILMLETDGLPNTITMNFYDSANSVVGLVKGSSVTNGSQCKDTGGKNYFQGGFASAAKIPSWTPGLNLQAAPFLTTTGAYSNVPAGMIGTVWSSDPSSPASAGSFLALDSYWTSTVPWTSGQTQSTPPNFNALTPLTNATGCTFSNSTATGTNPTNSTTSIADFAWWPTADVYGNQLNPSYSGGIPTYKSVSMTADGKHIDNPLTGGTPSASWTNYHNSALNAADNSAYVARSNVTLPAYVFVIGLGGNTGGGHSAPPDPVLLQRIANDPTGDEFNATPAYNACAAETGCATWSSQFQGKFIYSPSTSELNEAFQVIASQILRLSK